MSQIKMCNACQEPFDEVHPFDYMNDWTCYEVNKNMARFDPPGYYRCLQEHTWREHVQESYSNKGQFYINPHYPIMKEVDVD